ncbi:MAG: ABC transporter substrate-binding protein [bacterium]|nr:ABC transporter substrate-binding protein [bacterium]
MDHRIGIFSLLLLAAIVAALPGAAHTVVDSTGAAVEIASVSRVVVVGGDVAEIAARLGAMEDIVARDDTCLFPPELKKLPSVGYMRTLTPEGVLSVNPTLILATQGAGPETAIKHLRDAGAPLVRVSQGYSEQAVAEKIGIIAKALNREPQGAELIQTIQHESTALKRSLTNFHDSPRVLCLMGVQRGSVLAAGENTGAGAIIRLAGGRNAMEGFSGYKPVSGESIIASGPALILVPSHGTAMMGGEDALASLPELQNLPAVQQGRILVMDSEYLLMFGPRYVRAAAELAAKIHPGYVIPEALRVSHE